MSQRFSPTTNKKYGRKRVCLAWDISRSTFYSQKAQPKNQVVRLRPGPKTQISDEKLFELIQKDLETSPFKGEGHRKVYARLNRRLRLPAGRKRILRLMREHQLLSPHRVKQGKAKTHTGKITTEEPNKMWAVDGTRVLTRIDGWVWVFWSIEHWNAECMGWYVVKEGNRFAALEPVKMGLEKVFGEAGKDVANGLKLRMDHGSQYISKDFLKQISHWGIVISMGFVREPETNGVVERFNRTFKEQVIHGRIFDGVADLQKAAEQFIADYNESWYLEKLDFESPNSARRKWVENQINSTLLADCEENTATALDQKKDQQEKEFQEIHRAPSCEENTATALDNMMVAGVRC